MPKTKEAKNIIASLSKIEGAGSISKKKNAALFALCEKNEDTLRSFRNFGNLEIGQIKDLNALDLLQYRYLVITDPEKSLAVLSSRLK